MLCYLQLCQRYQLTKVFPFWFLLNLLFCFWILFARNHSWTVYLRVHVTSLTVMVTINSFSVNSRTVTDVGVPTCVWMNLFPSRVTVLLTLRPSIDSSSNSSSSLNEKLKVLTGDDIVNVYRSPSCFNSMVDFTEFASLRRTNPTPVSKEERKKYLACANTSE